MTRCCKQNGDERVADAAKAQVCTGAIFLRPRVSGMTMVAVGRVRQRMYPMISVGQYRWIGRRTSPSRTRCIAISIRQWHCSDAGSRPTLTAATGDVLSIAGRHLLTLVSSQLDGLPQLSSHRSTVSALPQQ